MKSFPEIPNWQAGTNSEYITHRNLSIPGTELFWYWYNSKSASINVGTPMCIEGEVS